MHKRNPSNHATTLRTRTWRKVGEGLKIDCTAKGKKEGVAGKMVKFMVAIAHGKGVVAAIPYSGNINGEKFAGIIDEHFPNLFDHSANAHNRVFLQDDCPSQNSAIARQALGRAKAWVFPIPARSPDCNPIENVFHLVGKKLKRDALQNKITQESLHEFEERCKRTLLDFSTRIIDRTIESMPKRMDAIIKNQGQRIKY